MREISFTLGSNLEEAVRLLEYYKSNGESVWGVFNGVELYSDTVTVDTAFKAVTGKTKKEHNEMLQDIRDRQEQEEVEFKRSLPSLEKYYREQGRKVFSEDRWDYWDNIVPIRLRDLYHGMELDNCLEITKLLNEEKNYEKAKEALSNQGHSGMSHSLVLRMISEFSDEGKKFVDYLRGGF